MRPGGQRREGATRAPTMGYSTLATTCTFSFSSWASLKGSSSLVKRKIRFRSPGCLLAPTRRVPGTSVASSQREDCLHPTPCGAASKTITPGRVIRVRTLLREIQESQDIQISRVGKRSLDRKVTRVRGTETKIGVPSLLLRAPKPSTTKGYTLSGAMHRRLAQQHPLSRPSKRATTPPAPTEGGGSHSHPP